MFILFVEFMNRTLILNLLGWIPSFLNAIFGLLLQIVIEDNPMQYSRDPFVVYCTSSFWRSPIEYQCQHNTHPIISLQYWGPQRDFLSRLATQACGKWGWRHRSKGPQTLSHKNTTASTTTSTLQLPILRWTLRWIPEILQSTFQNPSKWQ